MYVSSAVGFALHRHVHFSWDARGSELIRPYLQVNHPVSSRCALLKKKLLREGLGFGPNLEDFRELQSGKVEFLFCNLDKIMSWDLDHAVFASNFYSPLTLA